MPISYPSSSQEMMFIGGILYSISFVISNERFKDKVQLSRENNVLSEIKTV